jgi:hypothetical protein
MPRKDLTSNYQRPVKATLYVHLENGEKFPATAEDLERFDLVNSLDAYMRFDDTLRKILSDAGLLPDGGLTEAELNPVRYLVEMAVRMPNLLEHPEMQETFDNVVGLERILQEFDPEAPRG